MSTQPSDAYFSPPESKEPEELEVKKGHGCFFYGCITAIILFVVMIIAAVVIVMGVLKWINRQVDTYTAKAPMVLPQPKLSDEQKTDLDARWEAFKKALDEDKAATIALTGDEITTLIDKNPVFRGKVAVQIEGDKVKGEISMPLSEIHIPGINTQGRYLNGKGTFRVSLLNGILLVTLDELEVKGEKVPEEFMQGVRNQNLVESMRNDPKQARQIQKLESIVVKDGKITIRSRGAEAESKAEGTPEAEKSEAKKKEEETPETKVDSQDKAEPKPEADAPKKGEESKPAEPGAPADAPKPLAALTSATFVAALGPGAAPAQIIDLRTEAGAQAVKGEWRYQDVKIVEVEGKGPDGKPNKTYNIEPHAEKPDFDDGAWEVVPPEGLAKPRGGGQVCFCWYRTKITLPADVEGKTVVFVTTVDDYGEVWVDGQLPRKPGDVGGPIVAGFNAPNRVELKDPKPGKTYTIAIFGINGPISAAPGNRIFLGKTFLEIQDK
jgi:hypothetical protein